MTDSDETFEVGDLVKYRVPEPSGRQTYWKIQEIRPNTDKSRLAQMVAADLIFIELVFANPPYTSHRFRIDPTWDKWCQSATPDKISKASGMEVIALSVSDNKPVVKEQCPIWCTRIHDHGWPEDHAFWKHVTWCADGKTHREAFEEAQRELQDR